MGIIVKTVFITSLVTITLLALWTGYLFQYKDLDRTKPIPEDKVTIDNEMYDDKLNNIWWDKEGKMKGLHGISKWKIDYFSNTIKKTFQVEPKKLTVLDVGCGGGIISEGIAKQGFNVIGVDRSKNSIEQAKEHAKQEGIENVEYLVADIYNLSSIKTPVDAIIVADVLEHITDLPRAIAELDSVLKPGGILIFDTNNRTLKTYVLFILLMQKLRITGVFPKDTHDWSLFIKPEELEILLRRHKMDIMEIKGMCVNFSWRPIINALKGIITNESLYECDDTSFFYIGYAKKRM